MTATTTKRKLTDANCADNAEEATRKKLKLLKLNEIDEEKVSTKRITNYEHMCRTRARIDCKINIYLKLETEMNCQKAHYETLSRFLTFMRKIYSVDHKSCPEKCQIVVENGIEKCVTKIKRADKIECIRQLECFQSNRDKYSECLRKYESELLKAVSDVEFKMTSVNFENFMNSSHLTDLQFTLPRQWYHNLTNETVKSWLGDEEDVYVLRRNDKSSFYGKVIVESGRYWISNLSSRRPEGCPIILSLYDIFICFGGPLGAPNRAFLQLGDRDNIIGDIIIAMDDVNPRLTSKIFLCSEVKGKSYKTETFLFWVMVNEESRKIAFSDDSEVTENQEKILRYSTKNRSFLFSKSYFEKLSRMRVALDDRPAWRLFCKFGIVKEGVEICQRILEESTLGKFEEVFIHNCGVVL